MSGPPTLLGQPLSSRRVALVPLDRERAAALHGELGAGWPRRPHQGDDPDRFHDDLWEQSRLQFVVARRSDGRPVGLVQGLDEDLRNGTIAVGLAVSEERWRAGWPLEGLVLFVNLLVCGFGYRKLTFEVPAPVAAGLAPGTRALLTEEGTWRDRPLGSGGVEDVHVLALFGRDWDRALALALTGNGPWP